MITLYIIVFKKNPKKNEKERKGTKKERKRTKKRYIL